MEHIQKLIKAIEEFNESLKALLAELKSINEKQGDETPESVDAVLGVGDEPEHEHGE